MNHPNNRLDNGIADDRLNSLADIEIILIDNFDSFTYNLVNQLRPLVNNLRVFRNNVSLQYMLENIFTAEKQQIIVLSPGPGDPDSAGITLDLIAKFKDLIPIMGICLGHQAIVQSYSGKIGAAKSIVHGKACDILLDESENQIFGQLQSPFRAARYHSLAATRIPPQLKVIATSNNDVMAVRHLEDKVLGFQFHPESILTPKGSEMMKQALLWLSEPKHNDD